MFTQAFSTSFSLKTLFSAQLSSQTQNSNTLTWTTSTNTSLTNVSGNSAMVTITGPTCTPANGSNTCNPVYTGPVEFQVYQDNQYGTFMFSPVGLPPVPTPSISTISPATAMAGGATFTLTVNGSSFVSSSSVYWGGNALVSTFVNATQLTAAVPASLISLAGNAAIMVENAAVDSSNSLTFLVSPSAPPPPTVNITSLGNAASFTQSFAPGMLMSVFGTSLSSGGPQTVAAAPLPLTSASGTSVTINGIAAPLLYISATQINLQIPYEVAAGNASLSVSSGGKTNSVNFAIQSAGPGIFVDSSA